MSLFAAYADANTTPKKQSKPDDGFLSFSSYKIDPPIVSETNIISSASEISEHSSEESSDSDSSYRARKKRKHKKKRKKHRKKRFKDDIEIEDNFKNADFMIDRTKVPAFLKVNKLFRPTAPRYFYMNYGIGDVRFFGKNCKKKIKRYFNSKYLINVNKEEQTDESESVKFKSVPGAEEEENMSRQTAFYNQSLGKDPFDVEMWLQYVKYQDKVYEFEKNFKKGSIAKGLRVTSERKLAILDKALTHNPNNEQLSREKIIVAQTTYASDEVATYLKSYVEKNPGNIIYWQGYIEATQCSMAHCNAPAVIELYNKCLTKLHQLRRTSTVEKLILEERILSMLYQCGLFLRQSGSWEQLWTLLQLYLELNLSFEDKNKFKVTVGINDKQIIELEEVILESQLPIHELWLRVEKIRESCHWIPYNGAEPCEDPQRVVFIDDLTDLIHPITSTGNTFRLTVMILTLLKIPLLPCRHNTIKELGLDYVPWALDTIETLYPVFFPLYPVDLHNKYILKGIQKLAVGPQYIKTHPGQEEYLTFLTNLMRNCADSLQTESERNAIYIWWLRFERLLIVLNKQNRFKMPAGRQKKVKSSIKEFLKKEENRNNVLFYKEYALIEYELGNFVIAYHILTNAMSMQSNSDTIVAIADHKEKSEMCALYRTLIELYLYEKNNIKAVEYLVTLIDGSNTSNHTDCSEKYKNVITELLQDQKNISPSEHFLPDYTTDLIICYGWFLFLTRNYLEAGAMIENVINTLEDDVLLRKEILMEWYVTIFYKTCTEVNGVGMYGLFHDILNRGLIMFPNNLYLLAVTSKEYSASGCVGKPWWKLINLLSNCGHAMPALFLAIMANQQLAKIKDEWDEFDISNPIETLSTYKNRIQSLFSKLTQADMCSKRCGLLWRLYLQYLYSYSDPETCRKAYYLAVEECPWLKALYIDAAIYIPAELPQIQDLIIEKQLRIHVTPEELDVLR